MEQRNAHPLDIDLLDLALGDTDASPTPDLEAHLETCLLCRIRIARIRRSSVVPEPLVDDDVRFPSISPSVLAILRGLRPAAEPARGQVWLAGDAQRVLVWVDAIEANTAFVYAVTLDVDMADDTGLIASLPNLGYLAAIVTSVSGTVPVDRLAIYVDNVEIHDEVQRLLGTESDADSVADLPTGTPIAGITDERLEFRQLLADDLAALDPIEDESDSDVDGADQESEREGYNVTASDVAARDIRMHLSTALIQHRSPRCRVRDTATSVSGSFTHSARYIPVASIHELDCIVLVVTVDEGPEWALEHSDDAFTLLCDTGASALAVARPAAPYDTCVFEASHLRHAFQLPAATVKSPPRATIEACPIEIALHDYLDQNAFQVNAAEPVPKQSHHPDVVPHLRSKANTAVNTLRAKRAQKSKNQALKSLGDADVVGVADALTDATTVEDILARIDRIADR